jgi:hypothetical protein
MVTEATLGTGLHVRKPFSQAARELNRVPRQMWRTAAAMVSDAGDEHEMAEEFGNSLARAGDRVVGFAAGAGIIAAAWLVWMLI